MPTKVCLKSLSSPFDINFILVAAGTASDQQTGLAGWRECEMRNAKLLPAIQMITCVETLSAGALSNASAWSLPLPAPLDQLAAAGVANPGSPPVPSLAGTIDGSRSVAPALQIEQSVIGINSHLIADLSVTPLNVPVVPAFDISRAWSQVSNCSLGVLPLPSDYEAPAG